MCVIAYKAKDVRFPTPERVRECWMENPDGAGIMWRDNKTNKIRFAKGFMSLNKLEKFIRKNYEMLDVSECALHFRITTHGGTSKGNCHPFVCDCDADPHQLNGEADFVMMHNGILPIRPRRNDISDSAELALRIGRYANPMDVMDVMDELCVGSRIIVFGPDGTMMYGDQFKTVDDDGILYSNDHFLYGGDWCVCCSHPIGFGGKTINKLPKRGNAIAYDGAIVYDHKSKSFVDAYTGVKIDIKDVDPDMLSEDDYDTYCGLYEDGGNPEGHEDDVSYDPELVEEAHYYGMSVKEYLKWTCEECSADKKTEPPIGGDVVACM